jgi:predicted amidohydrolase YtcJ
VLAQNCGMCPDTIFYNGHIMTGAHLRAEDHSDKTAYVTAVAVRAGRVVGIGTDEQMLAEGLTQTKRVNLQGAFAMPGFNDAHTHMAAAGQQKLSVDLDNVPSLAAMQAKIREYAATLAPRQWILGGGWDHTKWASKKLPTRQDLDAVTGDHPAYLERTDGHIAVVNTAALRAAHITAATKAPAGSQIDVEAGSMTGIVREGPALALIQQVIPKPTPEMRRKALMVAIQDALSHGVTSVQDFSDYEDFLALEAMEQDGSLHLRFSEWLAFETPIGVLDSRRAEHSADDNLLHLGMLKAFMDGSLGSRTALMSEPYSDAPDNSGLPRYDQEKLNEMSSARAADGFQLGFHAIGDRANDMALNAFAQPSRWHAQPMPCPRRRTRMPTLWPQLRRCRCRAICAFASNTRRWFRRGRFSAFTISA